MRSLLNAAGRSAPWRGSAWFLSVLLLSCVLLLALWGGRADRSAAQEVIGPLAASAAGETSLVQHTDPSTSTAASSLASAAVEAGSTVSHTVYLPVIFGIPEPLSFGVQVNHIEPRTTSGAANAGADWVRMRLRWDAIEPENTTPEKFRWSPGLDQELASYADNGVRVLLTIMGNPDWAATYPAGPIDKVDIGELAQFMQAVVSRYGAPPYNVKHWEMYNEPDNTTEWRAADGFGYFGDNPQAYVDLLEAVYQAMKEADPAAQVVFGGMAYDGWESGFSESFLDDVLAIMQANGQYPFDAMNFHYYPLFASKWEAYGLGIDIIAKTNYIRNKMSEYGADKPLICTETSMWSNCIDENVEVLCGSDEKQSRYVPQVYARSRAAGLEFSIWYMLYDVDEVWAWDYGLLDANLNPKLSHQAYLTLGRHLLGTDYSRTLSLSETGSNEIEAYEFLERNTTERVVVAWSNDGVDYQMRLRGASLVRVGKYGDKVTIYDGDDGQADGYVVVTIGPSPVYLRLDK